MAFSSVPPRARCWRNSPLKGRRRLTSRPSPSNASSARERRARRTSRGRGHLRQRQFVGDDAKAAEKARAEGGRDGNVGGIPAAPRQDPPDAGLVMARIESVPMAAEIDLEPSAEIHGL